MAQGRLTVFWRAFRRCGKQYRYRALKLLRETRCVVLEAAGLGATHGVIALFSTRDLWGMMYELLKSLNKMNPHVRSRKKYRKSSGPTWGCWIPRSGVRLRLTHTYLLSPAVCGLGLRDKCSALIWPNSLFKPNTRVRLFLCSCGVKLLEFCKSRYLLFLYSSMAVFEWCVIYPALSYERWEGACCLWILS